MGRGQSAPLPLFRHVYQITLKLASKVVAILTFLRHPALLNWICCVRQPCWVLTLCHATSQPWLHWKSRLWLSEETSGVNFATWQRRMFTNREQNVNCCLYYLDILEILEKFPPYVRLFSNSCGELQPSAAPSVALRADFFRNYQADFFWGNFFGEIFLGDILFSC